MIRKLIKYDLKNMTKLLVWFYAIAIIVAGIARFLSIWNNIQIMSIIASVFSGITYSAVATVLINMFIHIIMNFRNSFYKDESYLTHTLPVTKNQLLISKYIASLIVVVASVLVCVLSLFILFYSPETMQALKNALDVALSGFDISTGLILGLLIAILFFEITSIIAMSFVAIIYGNSYNQKKVLKGVITFIALYLAVMYLTFIIALGVFAIQGDVSALFAETLSQNAFLTVLIVAFCVYAVATVLLCLLGKRLFNKGVNVD